MDANALSMPSISGLRADAALERARNAAGADDVDTAAKMFEELFATMLVKEMRRALPGGPFGDGPGADVMEGWFDEHMGSALARSGDLEIAQVMRASLAGPAAPQEGR